MAVGILVSGAACKRASDTEPAQANSQQPTANSRLTDDFGHPLPTLAARRIVSLNPTTTELLFALGVGDRVVGRTSWDSYPPQVLRIRDLGAGLRPNIEAVLEVRPDLVLLYASADNRASADRLRAAGIATISLKIDSIADFIDAASLIGAALGVSERAEAVTDSVSRTLDRVRTATSAHERTRAFWHVWDAPVITIGRGSFLHELLEIAGGRNVYDDLAAASPQVTIEDILRRDPDVVLAGPVGAAFMRRDPRWRALRAVRENRVLVVDTTLVARPSVRLGEAAVSLARLLHPGSL